MRRSERLAALQALLARVQRNARALRVERGVGSEPDDQQESREPEPAARAHVELPPPDDGMNWSTLLADCVDELADVVAATSPEAPMTPPPVSEVEEAPDEPRTVPSDPVERAPPSEIERVLRQAAERIGGRRNLFEEEKLRERRPSSPPAEPPEVRPAPEIAGALDELDDVLVPASRPTLELAPSEPPPARVKPEDTSAAGPPSTRRPSRKRADAAKPLRHKGEDLGHRMDAHFTAEQPYQRVADPRRLYVILTIGAAGVVIGAYAWWRGEAVSSERASPDATAPASGSASTSVSPPPRTSSPISSASAWPPAVVASESVEQAEPMGSSRSMPLPAPPTISRPKEFGLLWVDTAERSDVYVQGQRAGESETYLQVRCGLRLVRVAKRELPPPGESFPIWRGEGKTVVVPCGELHRISL